MNFVPCLTWVKRGISKGIPDKIQLDEEEFRKLIKEAKAEHGEAASEDDGNEKMSDDDKDANEDSKDNSEEKAESEDCQSPVKSRGDNEAATDDDVLAKYDMDNYDDDDEAPNPLANIAGLTLFASNQDDPYITLKDENSDSDEEDNFAIRPTDNLIVVGHVENDVSVLEVSVYNEESDDLYVHHDIILPSFPVAIEWLDFDPSDDCPCNYVAVGDMTPVINIWDLDLVNTLEPVYKLGYKLGKKKKKLESSQKKSALINGHTDAVLDLAWNRHTRHVLASGSADHTIVLWDLSQRKPVTKIGHHTDKVQTLQWHPFEPQTLLTGGCDSTVWLHDCRDIEDGHKHWTVDGEVERVQWSHFDPFCFLASTDQGYVYYYDARAENPVFILKAHDKAVTGLSLSSQCPGCLITSSVDKSLKVWDLSNNKPRCVMSKVLNLGSIYTLMSSPDSPFVVAVGGDNRSNNFKVLDIQEFKDVQRWFSGRQLMEPVIDSQPHKEAEIKVESESVSMETDAATTGVGNLSLQSASSATKCTKKVKRKNKKRY